ncbi:MAG TPA: sigma-70 family RNA polymerase sigma factor [Chryseolinea sp.]|nr:sigma-70 family RNA polymerase sigma factor [Chryseolinea sp.]HPH47694.1 sigma-70 family RNA polymerase sigma factor [Chryseolinea sp.]HPM28837.1 sigma-70 family RNA polymerase sigma factor [Chryseolinea sp.]
MDWYFSPATFYITSVSNDPMMDDRALVSNILEGNMQAFRLLIKQHERLVAHMIGRVVKNKEETEELCQDVFLRVYDKLSEFSFKSKLSTWIATIAYRHAINQIRKNKMLLTDIPEEDSFTNYFVEEVNPESVLMESDLDEFVLKLVDQLPPQYKIVLTLFHLDGMSYPEIGEVTGMPEGTVKSYLFRARNLLKEKVKHHLGKEEVL